jgi:hypothetical protein
MAHGVKFDGANREFKPPVGRDDVSSLHVYDNGIYTVSCWELTDEELKEILKTKRVFLSVFRGAGPLYPAYVGSESTLKEVSADYGKLWK